MNSFDLFGNPTTSDTYSSQAESSEEEYSTPLEGTGEGVEEENLPKRSFRGLIGVGIIITLVLLVQCYNLQVRGAAFNRAKAEGNTVRFLTIPASRGLIEDDTGAVLAQNSSHMALAINPQTLPSNQNDRQAVYALLKSKAGIDDATIAEIEKKRKTGPETFPIKTDLSKEEQLLYTEWFATTPGVILQENPIRLYTAFPSEGQLLGYVGTASAADEAAGHKANEQVGKSGLEAEYDAQLAGTAGTQQAEVNAQGQIVRLVGGNADSDPVPGKTLKLNLDLKLQNIVASALQDELARRNIKYGPEPTLGATAVVMNPNTGAIMAMVSLPDYNSQQFANGISQTNYQALLSNPGNPLLNRAVQGEYAPGSTIKPLVGAGGLQSGAISANFSWVTPCVITLGSFNFPDWTCHHSSYASNMDQAIADSNDVYFYALGGGYAKAGIKGMGIDTMDQYLSDFGLGSKTGIDLPSESAGLVPNDAWKRQRFNQGWYIGDTYHSAIGQGYDLVTPLQMATATAAIANGGTLYRPQLAQGYVDTTTGKETLVLPTVTRSGFISSDNIKTIQQGMIQTVASGSGRALNTLTVTSAGKTGSAQVGAQNQLLNAWYTGYAPATNPQIAFAILIEGDDDSFYASVPVAEEILRGYFNDPLAPGQKLSSSLNLNPSQAAQYAGEH